VPWWGPRGAEHRPSWRGWGGPRVVNNVVVTNTTVVNVQNITVYRNASVPHAIVAVDRGHFGHGPVSTTRIVQVDPQHLRPLGQAPQISATSASLAPTAVRGVRPSPEVVKRLEVKPQRVRHEQEVPVTVAPRVASAPSQSGSGPKPDPQELVAPLPRPSFGHGTPERPMTDRKLSPAPPRPSGAFSGSVPPGHAGQPTPAAPAFNTEPGKEPGRQVASRPAESVPPVRPGPTVPPAGNGPNRPPALAHPPTSPVPAAPQVELRSPPATGHAAPVPPPPPTVRQGPSAPASPARVETMAHPKTGGPGAPTVTGYSVGHPPLAATPPQGGRPAAHALPGEPANRLAPGRAQQSQHGPARPQEHQD